MIRGDCKNNARHALRNCVSRRYHHKISHFVCVFIFFFHITLFFVFASYCSVCSSYFLNRRRLLNRENQWKTLTINNVITYQFDWENGFVQIFIFCCLIRSHSDTHTHFKYKPKKNCNLFHFSFAFRYVSTILIPIIIIIIRFTQYTVHVHTTGWQNWILDNNQPAIPMVYKWKLSQ